MTTYLLHSTILLSAISAIYWLALQHETWFKLNRWTIMISIFLALTIPLIQIPSDYALWRTNEAPISNIADRIIPVEPGETTTAVDEVAPTQYKPEYSATTSDENVNSEKGFSIPNLGLILTTIYFIGVAIFFIVFLMQLIVLLVGKSSLNSFKVDKYNIVEMVRDKEPFSFLNSIYINPSKYDEDTYNHIIEHEKIHIDQSHFLDKIIAEILVILFWFNPLTWLLRSGISRNLEFLTDHSLIEKGIQKKSYQMSLLKVSVSNKPFNLTMSYNSSFLKNRIDMMNAKKSSIVSSWKYLFIPPLFLLSVLTLNAVNSVRNGQNESIEKLSSKDKAKEFEKEFVNEMESAFQTPKSNPKVNVSNPKTVPPKVEIPKIKDIPQPNEKAKYAVSNGSTKKASVVWKTTTLNVDYFDRLGLAVNGDVELTYGKKQSVKVEGPSDLINELSTEVKDGNWNISFKDYKNSKKYRKSEKLKFYITMEDLKNIAISGNGNVRTTNKFKNLDHLHLAVSGNGDLDIDADSKSLVYAVSGNGDATLRGNTNDMKLTSSGNGNINARYLSAETCKLTISGSSDVKLNVDKTIHANISGHVNLYHTGNPNITQKLSGSLKTIQI